MTRDVKVVVDAVHGPGVYLCFENAYCEFTDRLTLGQTRRLIKELEKALLIADPKGRTSTPEAGVDR